MQVDQSALAELVRDTGHTINWEDIKAVAKENRWNHRNWREAWIIAKTRDAIANSDLGRRTARTELGLELGIELGIEVGLKFIFEFGFGLELGLGLAPDAGTKRSYTFLDNKCVLLLLRILTRILTQIPTPETN